MRHPLVSLATIALATLALSFLSAPAHAQSFWSVTDSMFDDLLAETFACSTLGFDETPYDYSRCGLINDNMVDVNKRIVTRHMNAIGLTDTIPWMPTRDSGLTYHMVGFSGSRSALGYNIIYTEVSGDMSMVWVTANR